MQGKSPGEVRACDWDKGKQVLRIVGVVEGTKVSVLGSGPEFRVGGTSLYDDKGSRTVGLVLRTRGLRTRPGPSPLLYSVDLRFKRDINEFATDSRLNPPSPSSSVCVGWVEVAVPVFVRDVFQCLLRSQRDPQDPSGKGVDTGRVHFIGRVSGDVVIHD